MYILVNGIGYVLGLFGVDTSFVGALPTALMKSLSGSGANGLMIDTMKPVSYTHLATQAGSFHKYA